MTVVLNDLAISLDQFFTKKTVAKNLYDKFYGITSSLNLLNNKWLEPSAGNGAFFNLMPDNKIGIDLQSRVDGVIEHDFLTYDLNLNNYIVLGNPPFGKNSSLAIKFFNKCAQHSLIIGFIVPRTFKKSSVMNKLDLNFHLIYEEILDVDSFELNGNSYNVPCVFQVWVKKDIRRDKIKLVNNHIDFSFVSKKEANFAIQRVGANAGLLKDDFSKYAEASHYFIRADNRVKEIFRNIDYSSVKYNTAGNPSISKDELINLYISKK